MGCKELSSSSCAEFGVPINWKLVSQGISVVAKRKSSHLWCMMGNRELVWSHWMELGLIYSWFGLPRDISHSCGDITLLLDLWGISGGLSVLPSSKSRPLTCLIGNKELLCPQCWGIGPHVSTSGNLMVFLSSAGTWGMFSCYGGGSH